MKKFAFIVHLRASYREDMQHLSAPLGWIPDSLYRFALRNRPLAPFIWSDVKVTPEATQAQGCVIMLPYSGRQMLEQQKAMMPRMQEAIELASSSGAELVGLGALTSPITLGGKLLTANSPVSITNGNAFTAYITWKKVAQLIRAQSNRSPTVALVGATGSVGSLVAQLLATYQPEADYLLVARNERKLNNLAADMQAFNPDVRPQVSLEMDAVKQADIVVLLTSAADAILHSKHLKRGAIVLDDTQPRNTHPNLCKQRPDVTVIDGGLVAMHHLQLSRTVGLPPGLSYACLAETMLLALADHKGHFSIGNPTLAQAEYISTLAKCFSHLGFDLSTDYSFGKPLTQSVSAGLSEPASAPSSIL